jgi:alpha-D-xyloside xylohydrolase
MKKYWFLFLMVFIALSCSNQGYKKITDGVVVYPSNKVSNGAQAVKIQVVSDKIIHITAAPADTFSTVKSIMAIEKERPAVKWDLMQKSDTLVLTTSALRVMVLLKTGEVTFADTLGNPILTESTNGKKMEPVTLDEVKTYHVRQVFESSDDEAFYGLGQHQHGYMNLKGKDVDLTQFNTCVAIPFLVSSKNYGILWDNYSITKFGDPREYEPISKLKLYSVDGIAGGLTAKYCSKSDASKVFENRMESELNYEYLNLQKKFPASFKLDGGKVIWEGYVESDENGIQKFLLNSAGYSKMWLDNKLVVDKWRQCWNPNKNQLTLQMEKGKRYPVKIEWIPDGGESFISLKTLSPISAQEQNRLSLSSEAGDQIDYYFVYGNNTDEVISGYRNITGKATMLPKWAMGLWQSRERYKKQDELLDVVKTFREKNIPFDNIVLDWQYWDQDKWGSHGFDRNRFYDPKGMISDLHNKYNAQIMISVWPKYYENIANYNTMKKHGWLYIGNINNRQKDWVGPGYISTFYDAFNPDARKEFWKQISDSLFSKGIDGWWLDATEPDILSNISVADRKALMKPTYVKSPSKYFNTFAVKNAEGIYTGQRNEAPNQRVFILTRSAYAGLQRYAAATWSGDVGSRWEDFKLQISAGLNFSLAGMPYWTTDIGGFAVEKRYEKPSPADLDEWRELQTRWFQYGTFCPLFRVHGQFPFREMFNIAPENQIVYKTMLWYDQLRYRLMPYVYTLAAKTYLDDYTIMRGLIMDFAADPNVRNIDNQFMYGPSMLINPVTAYKATSREVYLPANTGWYDLYTGRYYEGGQNLMADAPLSKMPVFIKEGAIIPFGPEIKYAAEKQADPITLYVYTGRNGSFTLYEDENVNYNYEKDAYSQIPISFDDASKTLTIGERKGTFAGMLQERTFKIVWVTKDKPVPFVFEPKTDATIPYTGKKVSVGM